MTLGDIAIKARDLTGTDINSYPDANLLIDINIWYQKIVSMIFDSQDDADFDDQRNTSYPIKNVALIANTRDYNIPVSEKMLKLKDVSVTYDGVNYYRATPIKLTDYYLGNAPSNASSPSGTTQNTTIDAYFPKTAPAYDYKYNSIWIYPMANSSDVAQGAQILAEWYRQVTNFTSSDYGSGNLLSTSTVVPGFDDTFHPVLAYGPAMEYSAKKQLPQLKQIVPQLEDYESRLRRQYSSKQSDRRFILKMDYQNYK